MSSTTGCSHCRGLCAGAATRCPHCGTWIRKQDYYSTSAEQRRGRSHLAERCGWRLRHDDETGESELLPAERV